MIHIAEMIEEFGLLAVGKLFVKHVEQNLGDEGKKQKRDSAGIICCSKEQECLRASCYSEKKWQTETARRRNCKRKGKEDSLMVIKVRTVKKELLKDPDFRKEYEGLAGQYQLARLLIEARKKAGMTQHDVAEKMGTTQSAVARMESGEMANLKKIEKFAEATGHRITYHLQPQK
jgi:ribosome-binding protein aMBF1 (putative translation factor)